MAAETFWLKASAVTPSPNLFFEIGNKQKETPAADFPLRRQRVTSLRVQILSHGAGAARCIVLRGRPSSAGVGSPPRRFLQKQVATPAKVKKKKINKKLFTNPIFKTIGLPPVRISDRECKLRVY